MSYGMNQMAMAKIKMGSWWMIRRDRTGYEWQGNEQSDDGQRASGT